MIGNNLDKSLSNSPEKSVNGAGLAMTCFCPAEASRTMDVARFRTNLRMEMIYAQILAANAAH